MIDRVHTRSDEIVLENDFEWVNAWAMAVSPRVPRAAQIPIAAPQAKAAPVEEIGAAKISDQPTLAAPSRSGAAALPHSGSADTALLPTHTTPKADEIEHPVLELASIDNISLAIAPPASGADSEALFLEDHDTIASPLRASERDSAPIPFFEAARRMGRWTNLFRIVTRASTPEADPARELFVMNAPGAMPSLAEAQASVDENPGTMTDARQLAHDIAEIEAVRDRLLAMPVGTSMGARDRSAPVRSSDYVPILVGAVLAFTSLIVFGAAASFVSLR